MSTTLHAKWYTDPQGTYDATIADLMSCFRLGVISGAECGQGRAQADRCLREATAASAEMETDQ